MASQRLLIVTLAGRTADAAADLIAAWRGKSAVDGAAIDQFCDALRVHAEELPVLYYGEWIDRWLMGDLVPGPSPLEGRRFQLAAFTREEARDWAKRCGSQHQEQAWLAARLREAAAAWSGLTDHAHILVIREVFGCLAADEEVEAALGVVPDWIPQP